MLMAVKAKKNKIKDISATVHDDFSSRVQTVTKENNLKFYNLLQSFFDLTGIPVLLNTSFNIKGQPIVNTPQEAIKTFLTTKIDVLVIEDFILGKMRKKILYELGIMQGRLLPKYKNRFQAFPKYSWSFEFNIAKKLGFKFIEFIFDYEDFLENPLLSKKGLKKFSF